MVASTDVLRALRMVELKVGSLVEKMVASREVSTVVLTGS